MTFTLIACLFVAVQPRNATAVQPRNATAVQPRMTAEAPPRTLSLAEALSVARARQPSLRASHAQTQAAEARADEARAALLPQVTANAGYQRSTANFAPRPGSVPQQLSTTSANSWNTYDYFNVGVTASQLLIDGWQSPHRWLAQRALASSQRATEQAQAVQVALNVRTAYFAALAQKSLLQVARETVENTERHLKQIQGFVQLGSRPEIDVAQARTDRANAEVQLITAENSYAISKVQLNTAMGVEDTPDFEVADEKIAAVDVEAKPAEALLDDAMRSRPEVKALDEQLNAQELTVRANRGAYFPTIGAQTQLTDAGRSLNQMAWNWNAQLTLTWQLFQGLLTEAQVREASAIEVAIQAQRDQLRQQVRLDVEQARLGLRAAAAALAASGEALANAEQRLRLAEGRYQTGVGSVIELGDAQVARTNAASQKVRAEFDLATARANLLKALGRVD